jgi:hypothetical protein
LSRSAIPLTENICPTAFRIPTRKKAGFKREGKKLNGFVKDGAVYNLCVMGLLKEGFLRYNS